MTEAYWAIRGQERRWQGFLENAQIKLEPTLEQAIRRVEDFLMPICVDIQKPTETTRLWSPSGTY